MIPNFFSKKEIPEKLPEGMEEIVKKLKKSKNKEECLRKTYDLLTKKYRGDIIKTYSCLPRILVKDVNELWSKSGYLHCTHLNYLLRIFLVKSGFFKDEDIGLKWTLLGYISPHQYLEIRFSQNAFINIDVWANHYGIMFGDYAHGFHF